MKTSDSERGRGFESHPLRQQFPPRCIRRSTQVGRRGSPAKGVGCVSGARVQIPPSPPRATARANIAIYYGRLRYFLCPKGSAHIGRICHGQRPERISQFTMVGCGIFCARKETSNPTISATRMMLDRILFTHIPTPLILYSKYPSCQRYACGEFYDSSSARKTEQVFQCLITAYYCEKARRCLHCTSLCPMDINGLIMPPLPTTSLRVLRILCQIIFGIFRC